MLPNTAVPLLTVTGLHKAFGDNQVLRGIDFTVHEGEVLALIGPSGSGKTTALRCLNGLEAADSGTVAFAGGPQVTFTPQLRKKQASVLRDRSAMVFQGHHLFPHLTVLQNVTVGPWRCSADPRPRCWSRPTRCCSGWDWPPRPAPIPHRFPAASNSGWGSCAP